MTTEQLEILAERLEWSSKRSMDKHKAWQATQQLKLVRAEMQRRSGIKGIFYNIKRRFSHDDR